MSVDVLRWHEAFEVFEPEFVVEEFDWGDVRIPYPDRVRFRRSVDQLLFSWFRIQILPQWSDRWSAYNDIRFNLISSDGQRCLATGDSISAKVASEAPPIAVIALIVLRLNERFPPA